MWDKYLTYAGQLLLSKPFVGKKISFAKLAIGNGEKPSDPRAATSLTGHIKDVELNRVTQYSDGETEVVGLATNEGITEGFSWTEIGLWANDPDDGVILFACAYGDGGDIAPEDMEAWDQTIILNLAFSDTENVSFEMHTGPYVLHRDRATAADLATGAPNKWTDAELLRGDQERQDTISDERYAEFLLYKEAASGGITGNEWMVKFDNLDSVTYSGAGALIWDAALQRVYC